MKKYSYLVNGKAKSFKVPISRADITYQQWSEAYKHLSLAYEANNDFENGNFEESQIKIVQSMCHTIAALSKCISYEELINIEMNKIVSMFNLDFNFLQLEQPKTKFKINGIEFTIPDFKKATAGDFMDVMAMMQSLKEKDNDAEIGIIVASIYMRGGEYRQDLTEINERIAFLKEHGRMDLFYSCAFFLTSFFNRHTQLTKPSTEVKAEMEKLTNYLNVWGITLYMQALRKLGYSQIHV